MSAYLSIKDTVGNFNKYDVPEEVYLYVLQLETFINNPFQSKLIETYPERFNDFKKIDLIDPVKIYRLLKLINMQYGLLDNLIANGCDHGFKPASSCTNEGCIDAELHLLFNEIYWSHIIKNSKTEVSPE